MDNLMWLKLAWAAMAGAWGIAVLLRLALVTLAWPAERKRRIFSVVAHLAPVMYFLRRLDAQTPHGVPDVDLIAVAALLVFSAYVVLDGIWAVYGMTERRARNISLRRKGLTHDHP